MADATQNLKVVIEAQDRASAQVAKLSKEVEGLSAKTKSAESAAASLNKTLIGLFSAATVRAAVSGMIEGIRFLDQLGDQAQRIGLSAEAFQRLAYAARQLDVESRDLELGFSMLVRRIGDAARGQDEAKRAFDEAGISIRNQKGQIREANDILLELADRYSSGEYGARGLSIAYDLLGRNAKQLVPLLSASSEQIERLGKAAPVASDAVVRMADRMSKAVDDLMEKAKRFSGYALIGFGGLLDPETLARETAFDTFAPKDTGLGGQGGGPRAFEQQMAAVTAAVEKFQTAIQSGKASEQDILDYASAIRQLTGADIPPSQITELIQLFQAAGDLVQSGGANLRPLDQIGQVISADFAGEQQKLVEGFILERDRVAAATEAMTAHFEELQRVTEEMAKQQFILDERKDAIKGFTQGLRDYVEQVGYVGDQMKRLAFNIAQGMEFAFSTFFFDVVMRKITTLRDALASLAKMLAGVFASAGAQLLSQLIVSGLASAVAPAPAEGSGLQGFEQPHYSSPFGSGFAATKGGGAPAITVNIVLPGVDAHSAAQFLVRNRDSIKGMIAEAIHTDPQFRSSFQAA